MKKREKEGTNKQTNKHTHAHALTHTHTYASLEYPFAIIFHVLTNGLRTDQWTSRQMDIHILHVSMNGLKTDQWTEQWAEERANGWTDGHTLL